MVKAALFLNFKTLNLGLNVILNAHKAIIYLFNRTRRFKVTEQADILVVTPHPDDAEFGVAGTVARWTSKKKQVVYVVCTNQ